MRGWRRRGEAGTRLPPLKRKLPAQSRAGRRAHACAHRCLRAVKTSKQGHPCIVSPSASLSAAVRGEGGGWGRLGEGQEVDDAREPADHPGPRVHRHHPNLHPRARNAEPRHIPAFAAQVCGRLKGTQPPASLRTHSRGPRRSAPRRCLRAASGPSCPNGAVAAAESTAAGHSRLRESHGRSDPSGRAARAAAGAERCGTVSCMLRRSLRNTRRYRPANEHAKPPVRRRRRRRAFPAARRLRRIDALDTYRAPAAADMPKPMQRRAQMLGWSTPRTFRRDQLSVGLRPRHIFMTTAVSRRATWHTRSKSTRVRERARQVRRTVPRHMRGAPTAPMKVASHGLATRFATDPIATPPAILDLPISKPRLSSHGQAQRA